MSGSNACRALGRQPACPPFTLASTPCRACGASRSPAQSGPSRQRLPQRSCTQPSACWAVLSGMLSASGGGTRRSQLALAYSQGSTQGTGTQESTARGTHSSAAAQARHVRRRDSHCLAAGSSGTKPVGGGASTAASMQRSSSGGSPAQSGALCKRQETEQSRVDGSEPLVQQPSGPRVTHLGQKVHYSNWRLIRHDQAACGGRKLMV